MKRIIAILAGVALMVCMVYALEKAFPERQYLVKVIFCDDRPTIYLVVHGRLQESTKDILMDKHSPLTRYRGYLNVCEVKTIRELK